MWKFLTLFGCVVVASAIPTGFKLHDPNRAEELAGEFQGDMIISQEELDKWNGRIDDSLRWKNHIVPYWINTTYFNAAQVEYIHKAAQTINELHCLQLINRTDEVDYIQVSGDATGCSSSVGRRGGMQVIRLMPYAIEQGCFRLYTIVHEFIHAFGFHHMHSSHDRDRYVQIMWENIQAGTENNFRLYGMDEVTHFDVPYDYGSVMHYSPTGFSVNGQPTIVALHPLEGLTMGQRVRMTESDKSRIKRMYGCEAIP